MTTAVASSMKVRVKQAPSLLLLARDIKLSHSLFAMPFALLATFLAAASADRQLPNVSAVLLVVLCMVLARTMAMTCNRLADASLDALNPRTAGRAIPSGKLSRRYMLIATLLCGFGLMLATSGFWWLLNNPWPLLVSPLVIAWLVSYPFTKRFTWLCHFFLGAALALSPLAAALAIKPGYLASAEPYLLAVMVLCWVAGFDVIYALADVGIDRQTNVHSMPAHLGPQQALWISRLLHLVSLVALLSLAHQSPLLGAAFLAGVALVAGLLLLEHALVWGSETRHLHMAFFTVNGLISLVLGGLGIYDVLRSYQS